MKRAKLRSFLGLALFFLTIAVTVSVTVLIYSSIADRNKTTIALTMFGVILGLSLLCTLIDFFRRKFTVKQPVDKILDATQRIAAGDFSVRLTIKHSLRDYNEFDLISENLNKMAEELSKSRLLNNDFISNVSHELKTPLAVIQNYATAIQNPDLDDIERRRMAQTLIDTSKRLTALVGNILKLNKLENKKIHPELTIFRLDEMLAQCVLGYEEIIEEKQLELDCDLDEIAVKSSADYLELVWNNLISNALKFTDRGGRVSVILKQENGSAVVKVSDTGCGISPETGKHIFEKFYQGDTSHAEQGNGLGLALVKKVIDILGGTIFVESEQGKGSVFTVTLKGAVCET